MFLLLIEIANEDLDEASGSFKKERGYEC